MSEPILAFRDPWIIKMRELEAKRLQKNRKTRKVIIEPERMPWPETEKMTPERAWSQPRVR